MAAQQAGDEPVSAAKMRAGAEIGDHQAAGHAVEPAVERVIEILAGGRGADRRAHHHEHRNRDQREIVQAGIERLRRHAQRIDSLEQAPGTRAKSRPARMRPARRSEDDERDDENDERLGSSDS